jgi:Yip1-like protein
MFDLKRTLELVKGALFDPEPTWRAYLPVAGDWQKTAILLTGPLIVASTVIAYLISLASGETSMFGMFRPTIISSAMNIVAGALAAGIVAFIFSALAGAFGGKSNFALGLAAITLAFVPGYAGQALAWLPWIGGLLAFGLAIYGLVLLWRIIPIYLEVPDGKRTAHYIVSLIATIVVMMVVGNVTARILYGASPGTMMGRISQLETSGGRTDSLFGGVMRQAEMMAEAEEDRYSPPSDGELTERQVQEFIRVMDRAAELQADKEKRLQALGEKADKDDQLTVGDLGELMGSVTDLAGMQGGQIEVVKTAGGNWAEHEWVRTSLRRAWIQKDTGDAIASNYKLYLEYEAQLARYVAR